MILKPVSNCNTSSSSQADNPIIWQPANGVAQQPIVHPLVLLGTLMKTTFYAFITENHLSDVTCRLVFGSGKAVLLEYQVQNITTAERRPNFRSIMPSRSHWPYVNTDIEISGNGIHLCTEKRQLTMHQNL